MVSLEFHDPSGAIEVKQPHAPRIVTLQSKRIGFVSNEQWQAYRMLPKLKALLEADFPGIEVLPIDAFPQGNAVIGSEETAALVKASGGRRRHHRQRGLRVLRNGVRPGGRQARSTGNSDGHADPCGFRGGHDKRRRRPWAGAGRGDGHLPHRDVPARQ